MERSAQLHKHKSLSLMEQIVQHWIRSEEDEEPEVIEVEPVPATMKGKMEALVSRATGDGEEVRPSGFFDNFKDFVEESQLHGLARDTAWLKPHEPRVKLKSGWEVTRRRYNQFLAKLASYGWVEKTPSGWAWKEGMSPALALDLLEQWKEGVGGNSST